MSLVTFFKDNESQLSSEVVDWLQQCPDPSLLQSLFEHEIKMRSKTPCYACEEDYALSDLRFDEADPYGDPSQLICHACWHSWDEGSIEEPTYRPPPWPERLNLDKPPSQQLVDGFLLLKGTRKCIGRVEGYNARGHTAKLVVLNGMENCAEGGSVDRDCVVIPYDDAFTQMENRSS